MGLCSYFWRSSERVRFSWRDAAVRSVCTFGALSSVANSLLGVQSGIVMPAVGKSVVSIRLMGAGFGSLIDLSSLVVVRLCVLMCLFSTMIMPLSFPGLKCYVQCYCTRYWQNAHLVASDLAVSMKEGLNVKAFFFLVSTRISKLREYGISSVPSGMAVVVTGRLKSDTSKPVSTANGFTVGTFSSRILDIGIVSSCSTVGVLGIKVSLVG